MFTLCHAQTVSGTFAKDNNMTLVAGDFYRITTSPASIDILCEYNQCLPFEFPYAIPGLTNRTECSSNYMQYTKGTPEPVRGYQEEEPME